MEKSPSQNIQDAYLNMARRERLSLTINLLQGTALTGRIKSFDKFSLIVDSNGTDVLIFKHAISTILNERKSSQ